MANICDASNCLHYATKDVKLPDGNVMRLCDVHYVVAKESIESVLNKTPSWENVPE